MTSQGAPESPALDCPSAQPDLPNARIFGVIGDVDGEPRVSYLERAVPATDEWLALAGPLDPTSVLRIAGTCQKCDCPHFESSRCTLAEKAAQLLPPVVDSLAPCAIRKTCRWFAEQGRTICLRCSAVTSRVVDPSDTMLFVTDTKTRLRHLPLVQGQ